MQDYHDHYFTTFQQFTIYLCVLLVSGTFRARNLFYRQSEE